MDRARKREKWRRRGIGKKRRRSSIIVFSSSMPLRFFCAQLVHTQEGLQAATSFGSLAPFCQSAVVGRRLNSQSRPHPSFPRGRGRSKRGGGGGEDGGGGSFTLLLFSLRRRRRRRRRLGLSLEISFHRVRTGEKNSPIHPICVG